MLTRFQSLCYFLTDADPQELCSVTFEDLCLCFHADPVLVDRSFYSVFGMSGDEIMQALTKKTPDDLLIL